MKRIFINLVILGCIVLGPFSETVGGKRTGGEDVEAGTSFLPGTQELQQNQRAGPAQTRPLLRSRRDNKEKAFYQRHPGVTALIVTSSFVVGGPTLAAAGLGVYCAATCQLQLASCFTSLGTCLPSIVSSTQVLCHNETQGRAFFKAVPCNPLTICPEGMQVGNVFRPDLQCTYPNERTLWDCGTTTVCDFDRQYRECLETKDSVPSTTAPPKPSKQPTKKPTRPTTPKEIPPAVPHPTPSQPRPQPQPTWDCPAGMRNNGELESDYWPCSTPYYLIPQNFESRILSCGLDHRWHMCQPALEPTTELPPTKPPLAPNGPHVFSEPQSTAEVVDTRAQHTCPLKAGRQCWRAWDQGNPVEAFVSSQWGCYYGDSVPCPSFVSGEAVCWPRTCKSGRKFTEIWKPGMRFGIFWQCEKSYPCETVSSENQYGQTLAVEEWTQWIEAVEGSSVPHRVYVTINPVNFGSSRTLASAAPEYYNKAGIVVTGSISMGKQSSTDVIVHELGHILTVPHNKGFARYIQKGAFCGPRVLKRFGKCVPIEGGHWLPDATDVQGQPINIKPMRWAWQVYEGISELNLLAARDTGLVVRDTPLSDMGFGQGPIPLWNVNLVNRSIEGDYYG